VIVTLTLNPSLDRAVEIESLERGAVLRAARAHIDPGGKGVNVSRALLANGMDTMAVLPCGGDEGEQLVRMLKAEGVRLSTFPITGRTRSNLTLAEPDGTITKINEPGPELTAAEFTAITKLVLAAGKGADWVVICGSNPPGLPLPDFARLCGSLVEAGVRLAVDTSGPALRTAAETGVALVKPNREELAEAVGAELHSLADVVEAAQQVRSWGAQAVLASMGADGAVLVGPAGLSAGVSRVPRPRSSVGAGDALLAGFLAARTARTIRVSGQPDPDPAQGLADPAGAKALEQGLAWGAAAVSLPGSQMPGPDDILGQHVEVSQNVTFQQDAAIHLTA
jgi:1-phosphofructokinase